MGAVSSFLHSKPPNEIIPSRQVKTNYGVVEGLRLVDEIDLQVDAFLGIPFAKPPIGELRFQKPQPPEPWDGVLKATKFGPRAPQTDFIWEKWSLGVGKSEDCLRLNVFSPAWEPSEDQPNGFAVMVFVHGGGFLIDSAVKYGDVGICRNFCLHEVVVVTVQYRLGYLGFFSTGDESCVGNLGLWDQTEALRWVKENIKAFGGDPDRVTVFGQSAGGVSVDLLSLSPESRDLFHQVVPMGGTAECDWALTDKEKLTKVCEQFAHKMGWPQSSSDAKSRKAMIKYLRTKPAKSFGCGLLGRHGLDVSTSGLELAPYIDGQFLPKPISQLRKEAPKKRCMTGTCEYEGLLFAALGPNHFNLKGIEKLLLIAIPNEKYRNARELRKKAREIYLRGIDLGDKDSLARVYAKLYSDLFVNNGTYAYTKSMLKAGHTVYLYSFDYFNPKSFGILSFRLPFKAPTHCTEMTYLFGQSIVFPFKLNAQDKLVMGLMTKVWTNFAKHGDPNGPQGLPGFTWKPVTDEEPHRYLSISLRSKTKTAYEGRRGDFWEWVKTECAENQDGQQKDKAKT